VKKTSGLGHWEENLELWKIFGIFLEIFGRGGKWTTVYRHGGNGSPIIIKILILCKMAKIDDRNKF